MITDAEMEQFRELRRQQERDREYRLLRRWHDLLDSILPSGRTPEEVESFLHMARNEPVVAFASLLHADALGSAPLPDETVAQLWDVGYEMEFEPHELLSDEVLAAARPERRTRPGPPWNLFGGGHGPGRAIPGKREFPSRWSDETTLRHTMDVAQHPSGAVQLPNRDFRAWGERDGVLLSVLLSPIGEVLTSYPVSGEGVVQHPVHRLAEGLMPLLRNLLESVTAPSAGEPRCSMDELLAVGEWPHLILSLEALGADERTVAELRELAGL
jgi:hypothetical protein